MVDVMVSSPTQPWLAAVDGGMVTRIYEHLARRDVFAVTMSNTGGDVGVTILLISALMDGMSVVHMAISMRLSTG